MTVHSIFATQDRADLLHGLNSAQQAAVTTPLGNALVLAGAGSGKTRVLVHRIGWLLVEHRATPWDILAVTFTNKAAREIRSRVETMLGGPLSGIWVGTFHGIAHRLLQTHWQEAGLPKGFQILDADDQLRLVKRVLKSQGLDDKKYPPRQVAGYINRNKEQGIRPESVLVETTWDQTVLSCYREYQQHCERSGAVDFSELLLRTLEMLRNHRDLQSHYQQRFRHILVDEFQDTNSIQYALIRLLNGQEQKLFMVGDDDQSIYGWRGARVEHIQEFTRDFGEVAIHRLEQNYRSTANILNAANAVIANNQNRLGKNLWTSGEQGEPVRLYRSFNDRDEARFVVATIQSLAGQGDYAYGEMAILYRTTAQSRLFEEQLMNQRLPYRVYGGLKFFDRAEVRDAVAYLRVLNQHQDDAAYERICNVPPRGIGETSLQQLREWAQTQNQDLWSAAEGAIARGLIKGKAAQGLRQFHQLIQDWQARDDVNLGELVQGIVEQSGLLEFHRNAKDGRGQDRVENLNELVSAAGQFCLEQSETGMPMADFLAHIALESGDSQSDEYASSVQLMTLHSAKGLEFRCVFLVGMEDGLFPHKLTLESPAQLEEERRLCYVGMTRAMRRLYLTWSELRYNRGDENRCAPSRFLNEIPEDLMQEVRPAFTLSRPSLGRAPGFGVPQQSDMHPFALGETVRHSIYGDGVVISYEGNGEHTRIQVKFSKAGHKWLLLSLAKLSSSASPTFH